VVEEQMKQYLNKIYEQLKSGTERFAVPCFLSGVFFVIFTIITLYHDKPANVMTLFNICNALMVGIPFGVFWKLLVEKKHWENRLYGKYLLLANLPILFIAYGILKYVRPVEHAYLMENGLMFAFLCFSCFILAVEGRSNNLFATLFESYIFSTFLFLLSAAGIMLCLGAISLLLTNVKGEYYVIGLAFAGSIVGVFTFLGRLPGLGEKLAVPNYCKGLIMKVLVIIYIVLVVILYGYLLKIALARSFPQSAMNWYASLATAFYIFFSWCLGEIEDNKFYQKFIKLSGLVLIPIIVVQCWCIWIRFDAYGLTTLRYASMICVAFGIVCVIGNLLKWPLKNCFGLAGLCFLIFSFTPLNIIDVPHYQQEGRMQAALLRNKMYVNGEIVKPSAQVSNEDISIIHDSFEYLQTYQGRHFLMIQNKNPVPEQAKEQYKTAFMKAVTAPEATKIIADLKQVNVLVVDNKNTGATDSQNGLNLDFTNQGNQTIDVTGYNKITPFMLTSNTPGIVRLNPAYDAKDVPIMPFVEDVVVKYQQGAYDSKIKHYDPKYNHITVGEKLIYDASPNMRIVFTGLSIRKEKAGKMTVHGNGFALEK
jgi:hypothetical protein